MIQAPRSNFERGATMRKAIMFECPLCGKKYSRCTIVRSVLGVPKTHPDDVLKCPECNKNFKRADEKKAHVS